MTVVKMHTDRQNNTNIKKRQFQLSSPKENYPYNTPDGGSNGNSQAIGAVNCCRKVSTPEVAGILDPPHFYVNAT